MGEEQKEDLRFAVSVPTTSGRIDWSKAPEWANWGRLEIPDIWIYWYANKPGLEGRLDADCLAEQETIIAQRPLIRSTS